ncbi:hypothetical protein ACA910_000068 [Epithemia clementina (nom. ined.)]
MTNRLIGILLALSANMAVASMLGAAEFSRRLGQSGKKDKSDGKKSKYDENDYSEKEMKGKKHMKKTHGGSSCPHNVHPFSGEWAKDSDYYFNRITTFPVCKLLDPTCNTDDQVVSEIIDVTEDGHLVAFTDSSGRGVGLVDISDPYYPVGLGFIGDSTGFVEPTSVRIMGNKWALVAVNTSPDFVNPSGYLDIVDLEANPPTSYHHIDLGGQPDAVAISPDGNHVAIAIENERDEDLGDGGLPQMPAGYLVIIDSHASDPKDWVKHEIDLTGLDGLVAPEDPEPEYVDFNDMNEVVVTLQENNAIVIVDAKTKEIKNSFSAGSQDLPNIDIFEEDIISQCDALTDVVREPDGVAWVDNNHFFTADEGDWNGGSRSISLFDKYGNLIGSSGSVFDHIAAAYGHYPEGRSEAKGNEPETVYVDTFGGKKYLITLSERSSLILVSELDHDNNPWFIQALPGGVAPEGVVTIPQRGLIIVASENDDRGGNMRASLSIYKYMKGKPAYPKIISATTTCEENGSAIPIPFGALSGLAVDPDCSSVLYSIEDSFYKSNRFFKIDTSQKPAVLYEAKRFMDTGNVLKDFAEACECFDENPVNDDYSVNLDPEGISVFKNGVILVASEGDTSEESRKPSFVMGLSPDGEIVDVWTLPEEWNAKAKRWGFEGIAIDPGQEMVVVAGQVAWGPCDGSASPNSSPDGCTGDDPGPALHIFMNGVWSGYVYYPLDEPSSQNGGWVGIGDLSPLGNMQFAVLERDNQGGLDASIKKVYMVDLNGWYDGKIVEKILWKDLMYDLAAANGAIPEKTEGLACVHNGCWVNNDNDGVDDNSGENQLIFVHPH